MPPNDQGDERIEFILENSEDARSENEPEVKFESDDIIEPVKRRIGDYLSQETKEKLNNPNIKNGTKTISIRDEAGRPLVLKSSDESVDSNFTQTLYATNEKDAVNTFERLSKPQTLGNTIVQKGKTFTPEAISYLDALSGLTNDDSILRQDLNQTLNSNNLTSPQEPFFENGETLREETARTRSFTIQNVKGIHSPKRFGDETNEGPPPELTLQQMKNLSLQMLLEASGEYYVPKNVNNLGDLAAAKAASTAPGLARLGIRVPYSRFDPRNILNDANPDYEKDSDNDLEDPSKKFSFGNVNSPLVPFDALSSTSQLASAALLTITISALLGALSLVFKKSGAIKKFSLASLESEGDSPSLRTEERIGSYFPDKLKSKKSAGTNSFAFLTGAENFFLLTQTQNDYSECIRKGIEVFFGLDGTDPADSFINSFRRFNQSTGYYNVILRSVIKAITDDIITTIQPVAGIFTDNLTNTSFRGNMEVNPNVGLQKDPTNILNSISRIRNSKLLRFMDVLANLGDVALMTQSANPNSDIDGIKDVYDQDEDFPNPAALVKKNRISDQMNRFAGRMAWGSNTLRSSYLLPTSLIQAEQEWSGDSSNTTSLSEVKGFKLSNKNRLTGKEVEEIENKLDAYYVPFYFHDLRTNEIISFHAFITQLAENYSPSYNTTEGIGRSGNVYSYKNTTRNITLGFHVIATNPDDFNDMWYKINKFITLIYPQYTEGRKVNYEEGRESFSFVQPFSQLKSSTPIIRMRVGDLIKTNYSDFDLARLFGLGTGNFSINNNKESVDEKKIKSIIKKKQEIKDRIRKYEMKRGDKFRLTAYQQVGLRLPYNGLVPIEEAKDGPADKVLNAAKGLAASVPAPAGVSLGDIFDSAKEIIRVPSNAIATVTSQPSSRTPKKIKVKFENFPQGGDKEFYVDFTNAVEGTLTEPLESYVDQEARGSSGLGDLGVPTTGITSGLLKNDFTDKVQEFFNTNEQDVASSNPIFQAFNSTKGQGLAGVITSLQMQWPDFNWEVSKINSRAPMHCEINLSFDVIHDLNPGLDSNGFMTGAPYNVGSIMELLKINKKRQNEGSNSIKSAETAMNEAVSVPDDGNTNSVIGNLVGSLNPLG